MPRTDPNRREDLFDCSGLVAVITGGGTGVFISHMMNLTFTICLAGIESP